jgi:hypothetical protein
MKRLRNAAKDHILLFKVSSSNNKKTQIKFDFVLQEIAFPNARIEASSNDSSMQAAAIRLIINARRLRISMKKSLQGEARIATVRISLSVIR